MSLVLSVALYKSRPPDQDLRQRFDGTSVRIGRAPDNDWVLQDPEQHVSKHHCTIQLQAGRYVVTDTSTNGVFVNGSLQPLGAGQSAVLSDGDRLSLGAFDVLVRTVEPAASPFEAETALDRGGPFGVQPFRPSAPEPPLAPAPFAPDFGAVFEPPVAPAQNAAIPESFDWLSGRAPSPFASPPSSGASGTPPDHVAAEREFFRPPSPTPLIPDDWNAGIDTEASGKPAASSFGASAAPQALPIGAGAAGAGPADVADQALPLLLAFLEGAGLAAADLRDDPAALMRRAGQILRAMVGGLCEMLATRALIKGEYRVEQTIIRSTNNNPLKFTADAGDALGVLLTDQRAGYMPGLQAVSEGFRDVKAHELALMAGMQAAATALLQQFDPEQLKQRLDRHSILHSLLPGARQAKYWEIYEQEYRRIAADVSENVRGVFGRAFAHAYEEQSRKV